MDSNMDGNSAAASMEIDVLQLEGMDNCRKLPGLKLFRSARPDEATVKDVKTLVYHDIKAIIDFRDKTELLLQDQEPVVNSHYPVYNFLKGNFKPSTSVQENDETLKDHKHYFIPMAHCTDYHMALFFRAPVASQFKVAYYFLYDKAYGTYRSHDYGAKYLVDPHGITGLYKDMIQHCGANIAAALKLLCEPSNACALICCSFGKDRTGILVALVLHICGRDKEIICNDYARSKELIAASARMKVREKTEFSSHALTNPSFGTADYATMEELMTFIETKYSSIDQYLDSITFNHSLRESLRKNLIQEQAEL